MLDYLNKIILMFNDSIYCYSKTNKVFNRIRFCGKTIYNVLHSKGHILAEFHAKNFFFY